MTDKLVAPSIDLVEGKPALVVGAPRWSLTVIGLALVLTEGDFTITINTGHMFSNAQGCAVFSCLGSADITIHTFTCDGENETPAIAALNDAIVSVLQKALTVYDWQIVEPLVTV